MDEWENLLRLTWASLDLVATTHLIGSIDFLGGTLRSVRGFDNWKDLLVFTLLEHGQPITAGALITLAYGRNPSGQDYRRLKILLKDGEIKDEDGKLTVGCGIPDCPCGVPDADVPSDS